MKITKVIAKITAAALLASATLISAVSCGPKAIGLIPVYVGEESVPLGYEFTNEDFYVMVAFDNGVDREVEDFEFEIEGTEGGEYIINIKYEDVEYPVFVPISVAVYPSEMES